MKTIYLIRHGQTVANEKGLYCGQTDVGITEKAKAELLKLKADGKYPTPACYFTSGLKRANETLEILYGKQPFQGITDLKEYHFGDFEMKTYQDLAPLPDYQKWLEDVSGNFVCPGGESKNQFIGRVHSGFARLIDSMDQTKEQSASVICHGGVIVAIMEKLFPGERTFYEWQPGHGLGYAIVLVDGQATGYSAI